MCASLVFFTLTDNEKAVAVDRLITRHSACENVRMPSQSLFYLPFQRTYGKHVLHEITRERTLELLSPLLDDLAGSYDGVLSMGHEASVHEHLRPGRRHVTSRFY